MHRLYLFTMNTSAIILGILFILCLTASVVTRSVGLVKSDDKPSQKIWIPAIFGLSQGVMALAGYTLSRLMAHLFTYIADYMVFAMMLVVAVKLFVDSMRALKGKTMYTLSSSKDMLLLSILAAFNVFLYSLADAEKGRKPPRSGSRTLRVAAVMLFSFTAAGCLAPRRCGGSPRPRG